MDTFAVRRAPLRMGPSNCCENLLQMRSLSPNAYTARIPPNASLMTPPAWGQWTMSDSRVIALAARSANLFHDALVAFLEASKGRHLKLTRKANQRRDRNNDLRT